MLKSIIDQIPSERNFIKSNFRTIDYGQLKVLIDKFALGYSFLKGSNCALVAKCRYDLSLYLPCLENLSSLVFLQPSGLKENVIEEFYRQAEIKYVVTINDGNVSVNKLHVDTSIKGATQDTEIVLATSGTSGTPKLVNYPIRKLAATSKKDVSRGSEFTWGLCYDLNRFAGMQVYLQAIFSGSSISVSEASQSVQDVISGFVSTNVNALSATPSFWRKVLMLPDSKDLNVERITLGGEISDQAVINGLRKHYPKAKIIHIYASTEAGVGFGVQDNKEGFPSSFLENPKLPAKLKVVDNILWIKSQNSFERLLSGNIEIDSEGYINTGDIVDIKCDRVFFKGRESGSLNVGGNKVMPEEVEQVINLIEEVELSRVFGKKNPMLGTLVSAEIVPSECGLLLDKKALKQVIIEFCKSKLESYKIPVTYKIVDKIDINETGKIMRN